MPAELEERLERVADALPTPTPAARERARNAALAALGSFEGPTRAHGRPGRRASFTLAAVAISAATAALAILVAPWQSSPLATELALAALGDQPVIHAIVENSGPESTIVDLDSGQTSLEVHRTEYWYDEERDLLRASLSIGGQPLPGGEIVQSTEGTFTDLGFRQGRALPPRLDPALAGFARRYRDALESGDARVVGEEVVEGRETIVLRVSLRPGPSGEQVWEEVAVDADDYRPLRFRFFSGLAPERTTPWSEAQRVVAIEAISRDPSDFAPPERAEPRPSEQTGVDERTLTPAEAATGLERTALWPGRAVSGIELAQIELMRLTTRWTDGRVTENRALVFQYGANRRAAHLEGKPSLTITEGTSAQETPRFDGPPLPPGKLRLTGFGNADGSDVDMWFGSMRRDGVYISLESPQRELILAAARSMMQMG